MLIPLPFKKLENSSEWKPINWHWFLATTWEVTVSHRRLQCSLHVMDTFEQLVPEPPSLSLGFAWLAVQPCLFKGLEQKSKLPLGPTTKLVLFLSSAQCCLPHLPLPRHLGQATCAKAASCWEGKRAGLLIHWCGAKTLQTFPEHCLGL